MVKFANEINMKREVKYWTGTSDYDLETAKAMLLTGRYLYVGFMCHQSIEKILKAYWCNCFKKIPLKIHNLSKLAARVSLNSRLSKKQMDFIYNLEPLNIEARYPSKRDFTKALRKDAAMHLIAETEELQQWIKSIIVAEEYKAAAVLDLPLRISYLYDNYCSTIYAFSGIFKEVFSESVLAQRHRIECF